ncbi:MAG: ABC transporter transmembrane domain-containing protein [Acetobacteraceae bacterium]
MLILADNMLWRLGGWTASHCFVAVTGDLRRDLFQHLTGHSPSYFVDRPPGTLAGRITATGNAIYTVENTFAWNLLPPMLAVLGSIAVMVTVNPLMAAVLVVVSGTIAWVLSRLADRGRPLHHQYAADAAAGGRRAGRRHQQHASGPRVRRHLAGAAAVQRPGGSARCPPAAPACATSRSCGCCTPPSPPR